jgi:hypothetical protein
LLRAYVELKGPGIEIGTEHVPTCPDTVEKQGDVEYCLDAAAAAKRSERAVLLALEAAINAATPWWARLLRRTSRYCNFDGSLEHRSFDACTWSAFLLVPEEQRRREAFVHATGVLTGIGYSVADRAFNGVPVAVPLDRDPPTV